jgi:putative phosphoesterase
MKLHERTKIAVISDIQGNGMALEHVLHAVKRHGVDLIVCLGDIASGPEPVHVISLLRENHVICVRGNMDNVILNPLEYTGSDEDEQKYAAMDHWCHAQMTVSDQAYLRDLALTYAFEIGSLTALCFHGSPYSPDDVIEAVTPADELKDLLTDTPQSILMTGHMHLPMLRLFGEQFVVNPGSVGFPYGGRRLMPTCAEYAVLSVRGADFTVAFQQVHYEPALFKQRVLDSGMPHAAWYVSKWQV